MMYRIGRLTCLFLLCLAVVTCSFAQTQKAVNTQSQSWVSVNSVTRLSNKWGFIVDVHERRNNFFSDNSFHFVRAGVQYWLKENITLAAGYGHLWLAPTVDGWHTIADENRIYEQVQITSKLGRISMAQRLRLEQRWQEKIIADKPTGEQKFTNRFRYQLSLTVPVVKRQGYPSFVIADEIFLQSGKEVVFNTFDQNRLFVGLKQNISKQLSFDIGYMLVNQQKPSGMMYDKNHTFRLFFYLLLFNDQHTASP